MRLKLFRVLTDKYGHQRYKNTMSIGAVKKEALLNNILEEMTLPIEYL